MEGRRVIGLLQTVLLGRFRHSDQNVTRRSNGSYAIVDAVSPSHNPIAIRQNARPRDPTGQPGPSELNELPEPLLPIRHSWLFGQSPAAIWIRRR
jgi:hypothetical protein